MRIARLLLVAAATATAFAGPAGAQSRTRPLSTPRDDAARLREAVEASIVRTDAAFNRGDIDAFLQPMADDVWVYPPNAQAFQGPAAAHEYFTRGYSEGLRSLQRRTTGLERSGNIAYETGTYTIQTPGQGGATTTDNGKYVHVWKRSAEGAWRIHVAMWNSNLPAPPRPR
jgi:ketosteroid isomerase-like protein